MLLQNATLCYKIIREPSIQCRLAIIQVIAFLAEDSGSHEDFPPKHSPNYTKNTDIASLLYYIAPTQFVITLITTIVHL